MTSDASNKKTKTIVEFVEENSNLPPIWENNWKTGSDLQMPRSPTAIAWYGIVLAAGLYPIVVVVGVLIFEGFRLGIPNGPEVIFWMLCGLLFSFTVGSILGIIMTIPAYLLLQLFGWISGDVISSRGASGVYGGLTGFLASTGGGSSFIGLTYLRYDDREFWFFCLLLPLLAIVMGYVGAIWAGYRNRNQGFPFFEPLFVVEQQFTIWFLMKLTTIVAVLVVLCKAAGEPGLHVGIAWAAYCVVQTLLLLCDHGLRYWIGWR